MLCVKTHYFLPEQVDYEHHCLIFDLGQEIMTNGGYIVELARSRYLVLDLEDLPISFLISFSNFCSREEFEKQTSRAPVEESYILACKAIKNGNLDRRPVLIGYLSLEASNSAVMARHLKTTLQMYRITITITLGF